MTDLLLNHTTDAYKIRETSLAHGTDAYKAKSLAASHTTDASRKPAGGVAHSTSAATHGLPATHHFTDTYKRSLVSTPPVTTAPTSGEVLAGTAAATTESVHNPEISKNSSTFLSIGDGLSVMIGLPRIATWNTAGRPKSPKIGTMGFNTQTRAIEFWDSTSWRSLPMDQI